MERLLNYLDAKPPLTIDGHIHLFNWKEPVDLNREGLKYNFKKLVCFMDTEFNHTGQYKNTKKIYNDFIENHYDKNKHILLATGMNSADIFDIYNDHSDIIKGFGELKCYDEYKDLKLPYKKTGLPRNVCKFSSEHGNLPVYIHWGLNEPNDIKRLSNLLERFPTVPVVLCHCGFDRDVNFAYNNMVILMNKYSNLWTDISWKAIDFFFANPMLLCNLTLDRVFVGTDLNNKYFIETKGYIGKINYKIFKLYTITKYVNSDYNLKKLFKITK